MRYTNTCQQCGVTFETPYRVQQYCNRTCWKTSRPRQIHQRTCPTCSTSFETKDKRQKHCTPTCSHAAQAVLYRNRVTCACAHCGKDIAVKPSNVRSVNYCNRACKDRAHTANGHTTQACAICGKDFTRKNSRLGNFCSYTCLGLSKRQRVPMTCVECGKPYETIQSHMKTSTCCSHTCSQKRGMRIMRSTHSNTLPERMVRAALDQLQLPYTAQYEIGPFAIDFYLLDQQIALEVDGVYWHSLPTVAKRDKSKNAYLHKCGIRVVRISDTDIHDADDLPTLIQARLVHA